MISSNPELGILQEPEPQFASIPPLPVGSLQTNRVYAGKWDSPRGGYPPRFRQTLPIRALRETFAPGVYILSSYNGTVNILAGSWALYC
jgi:hypothetical protein